MADCAACGRPQHADTAVVCSRCADCQRQPRCGRCLADQLTDAAELWPELQVTAAGQARMAEPGPRGRGLAPAEPARPDIGGADQQAGWPAGLPPNLAAVEVRDSVRNTVTTWVRHIAAEKPTVEPVGRTPTLLRWLAGQVGWVRHQPWADEAVRDLRRQCGRVEPAVDRPKPRVDAGLCLAPLADGACQQRLSAGPAAAYVHCPVCGRAWSATDRRETILAGARHLRGTAEEIAAWLSILVARTPSATVRSWAYRRRLLADRWGRYSMDTAVSLRLAQADQREKVST